MTIHAAGTTGAGSAPPAAPAPAPGPAPGPVERMLTGLEQRDRPAIERLLGPRVRLVLDGGDSLTLRAHSRALVADALLALAWARPGARLEPSRVDGRDGAVLRRPGGAIESLLSFEVAGRRIAEVRILAAPAVARRSA